MPDSSRAEAAYQRALSAHRVGARDAARRYAGEALADDPQHEGARALLRTLDSGAAAPAAFAGQAADRTIVSSPGPRVVPTPGGARLSPDRTIVNIPSPKVSADRTILNIPPPRSAPPPPRVSPDRGMGSPAPRPIPPRPMDATIMAPPPPKRVEAAKARQEQPAVRRESLWAKYGPLGSGHRTAALVGVAVLAVLLVGLGAWLLMGPSGGVALTIRKPTGGTITGKGIQCGTAGSDCTYSAKAGDTIELDVQPDKGYVFAGYTGDCAPGGRTIMSVARICGASFAPDPSSGPVAAPSGLGNGGAGAGHVLTINPPKNGTLLSVVGIQCGTKASQCSATVADGTQLRFDYLPDTGFQFFRYTGDCATGTALMNRDLTCGVEFSPAPKEAAPAAPVVRSDGKQRPGSIAVAKPEITLPPPETVAPPVSSGGERGTAVTSVGLQPIAPATKEAAPEHPETTAKRLIQALLEEYCASREAMSPDRSQKINPTVTLDTLRNQFRQFKSIKCMLQGMPEYVKLDYNVGKATVKIGVKQILDQQVGGVAPLETIMTTEVSRPGAGADHWVIDKLRHEPKPK